MVVFHQSAAKRRWFDCLHSYHDWAAKNSWISLSVMSVDMLLTTVYFAISIFMSVYYFAMIDYLKVHGADTESLPTVIKLLKARAGIAIAMSYICLCGFFWLKKRLWGIVSPELLASELDRKYEMYPRIYAMIILLAILRVASFVLASPGMYPGEIMKISIPRDDFVAKPLVKDHEDKESDFIVKDIVIYFWGWSFFFLATASISMLGFLFSPDVVAAIIYPNTFPARSKQQIFDLFFFTATQPFWTTLDFLLLLLECFECIFSCFFETLCCRKPLAVNYFGEYCRRHFFGKIRKPRYYNEPKLSVTYYWAGRGCFNIARLVKHAWHTIKTSVLGVWFGTKWWGMKVQWGIKSKKSSASGMTVFLAPNLTPPGQGCGRSGHANSEVYDGPGDTQDGRSIKFDDIELGEVQTPPGGNGGKSKFGASDI
ncbi:hypothetical protein TWF481_010280 [Arthrobotrys musiformis]|uniref:Uncharacterized protein n=1 Tax=Arthrobotrys musiformis TaxID=47236 RepID=A0AAV9W1Q7_9PEZI